MAFSEAFLEWERQTQERMKQEARQEARQEVRQEIQQEVRQEGQKEGRQAVALNLLNRGFLIEEVAQLTNLSIAEVQVLQSQR